MVDGGVQCWGDNNYGQLGSGDRIPSSSPVAVIAPGEGFTDIAAGGMHTCAAKSDNAQLKCWGANMFGQISSAGGNGSNSPIDLAQLGNEISGVAAGYATLAP